MTNIFYNNNNKMSKNLNILLYSFRCATPIIAFKGRVRKKYCFLQLIRKSDAFSTKLNKKKKSNTQINIRRASSFSKSNLSIESLIWISTREILAANQPFNHYPSWLRRTHQYPSAPIVFRICSKDSQNVNDHGAIRIQTGKNPL